MAMSVTEEAERVHAHSRKSRDAARRERRRARERTIIAATRTLFDERGMRDAPIDEIARATKLNKALIYRAFDSKEEIFVVTVTDYLAELEERAAALKPRKDPAVALREALELYVAFCRDYPAFLDCALSLMHQPAAELRERVSGAVWFRLGRAMAGSLGRLERILADGAAAGVFAIDDTDFVANRMYTQVLGSMHLARAGVGVREVAPGVAEAFELPQDRICDACLEDALLLARITPPKKAKTR